MFILHCLSVVFWFTEPINRGKHSLLLLSVLKKLAKLEIRNVSTSIHYLSSIGVYDLFGCL